MNVPGCLLQRSHDEIARSIAAGLIATHSFKPCVKQKLLTGNGWSMFARNLPLAIMLLFLLAVKARHMLAGFMVLTAFIQIVDVINDLARGDFLLVPGLVIFAFVFLIGAWHLFGQPIWQIDAWHEK